MCPSLTQIFIVQDLHVFSPQINPLVLPTATRKDQGQVGAGGVRAVGQTWGGAGSREQVSRLPALGKLGEHPSPGTT